MKLRKILNEIGDTLNVPAGINISMTEHTGQINFKFMDLTYRIDIKIPIKDENKIVLNVAFETDEQNHEMTNRHQALKVMSYIVGSIDYWLQKYKKKYFKTESLKLNYVKFNPKSEEGEIGGDNRRNHLYQAYIDKFARRYNSTVTFLNIGGIIAKFNPALEIK